MPDLEQLKRTINTVEQVQSIVRTMKALASVSVYPCEQALASATRYSRSIELGLQAVLRNQPHLSHVQEHSQRLIGIIVFGSDRGLCGRFNEEIAHFVEQDLIHEKISAEHIRLLAVGARVEVRLREAGYTVEHSIVKPASTSGMTNTVQTLVQYLDQWRIPAEVGSVRLYYHQQEHGSARRIEKLALLPMPLEQFQPPLAPPWPSNNLPSYTLDQRQLFAALVQQYLFIWIFRACAHSLASENAARLASMQVAERNISERLDELNMHFRHERQESITSELLEIVSGFEVSSPTV